MYTIIDREIYVLGPRAAPDSRESAGLRARGSAPKRGRHSAIFVPPDASVQWQPDGLTIHAKKWFLGAGFLGAPPISLTEGSSRPAQPQQLNYK